jgi:hypothetical protein
VLRNGDEAVAEARRRSAILKVGEELGLDKWLFKDNDTNRIDKLSPEKIQNTETNRSADNVSAEKVKALESQH